MFPLQLGQRHTISTFHRVIIFQAPNAALERQWLSLRPSIQHHLCETGATSRSLECFGDEFVAEAIGQLLVEEVVELRSVERDVWVAGAG
jgi:hypothetical protein